MDGIVLLAGKGERVKKITPKGHSKHSILVNKKPMGYYPTKTLVSLGVKNLIFVVNPGQKKLAKELGKESGIDYQIEIQNKPEGTPYGILSGLRGRKYPSTNFFVIFGDSFFEDNFIKKTIEGPLIFIQKKPLSLLRKSGVVEIGENLEIISLEEKPDCPKGDYSLRGLFLLDNTAESKIKALKKSSRGEFEIIDLIKRYLLEGKLSYSILEGFGSDMGTIEGQKEVENFLLKKTKNYI